MNATTCQCCGQILEITYEPEDDHMSYRVNAAEFITERSTEPSYDHWGRADWEWLVCLVGTALMSENLYTHVDATEVLLDPEELRFLQVYEERARLAPETVARLRETAGLPSSA